VLLFALVLKTAAWKGQKQRSRTAAQVRRAASDPLTGNPEETRPGFFPKTYFVIDKEPTCSATGGADLKNSLTTRISSQL
jgi:hypothetical protein